MNGTILVVGSLNMDLVFQLNRWPDPDETVLGRGYRAVAGGKGANQAVAASRQGATVHMVGCVGQDDFGSSLLAGLRVADVNVEGVRSSSRSTGVALVAIDPDGQSRIIVVAGANRTVTVRHVEDERAQMAASDWLLLQLETPMEANIAAARLARQLGTKVILTPSPAPGYPLPEELLANVDIIVPNRGEARALTAKAEPLAAAEALQRRGIESVIVTLGAEGALLVDRLGAREVSPFEVQAADTTGAGDAFVGALAAALARHVPMEEATRYAAAAGALAVTKVGAQAALPTLEAVESLIATSEGRPPRHYPERFATTFESNRGEPVLLRPILPADAPRLKHAFEELSQESIYRRFFTHRRNLSDEEARAFATVDYQEHFALVATPVDEPERLLAVARYARTDQRERAVELAIVVIDAFQGHGIGRRLFSELLEVAREMGQRWMLVETQPDNRRMLELAEDAPFRSESRRDGSAIQLWLDLAAPV